MITRKKGAKKIQFLSLEEGLKWPWNNAKRQWYALWILLPILGWFALGGYIKKILANVAKGDVSGLPEFGDFWQNLGAGFMLFLYLIPLALLITLVGIIPWVGSIISFFAWIIVFPYMFINVIVEDKFAASFDFSKWWRVVIGHFAEYVIAFLKSFIFGIVYFVLSLVIVGIPGSIFGKNIFIADFYAKYP
jgi:hypothetical protein